MTKDTVNFKLRVFISSKCEGKYEIVRKALQKLLEETGLVECWCFETEPASSEALPSMYLSKIDLSQLFILIVDNKDNVSKATMTEYKRAKELGKRIIAIFCDEDSKEVTEVENEIRRTGNCRYKTANKFSDITGMAYNAVMQDIVNVYMDIPIGTGENTVVAIPEIQEISAIPNVALDKSFYDEFDITKNAIFNFIYNIEENEVKQSSELDELFHDFIQVIFYNKAFDERNFDKLKSKIINRHDGTIGKVIEKRLDAVKHYFLGDLERCTDILDKLVDEYNEQSIPQWLFNDIAIDLRNMIYMKNHVSGIVVEHNNGQAILDASKEYLYFPALDRVANKIKSKVIKEYEKISLQSPYKKSYGNLDPLFADVASYYCTALLYGSITHLRITRTLLIEILQVLSQEYTYQEYNMQLIRLLILERNDDALNNIVRTYDKQYDIVNPIEIEKILTSISFLSIDYDRNYSVFLLLKYFGYYLSDKQFKQLIEWFISYSYSWVNDENRFFYFSNEIKQVYKSCYKRIDPDEIFNFITLLFDSNDNALINDACELIKYLNVKELSELKQKSIARYFEDLVENEQTRKSIVNLRNALIVFVLKAQIDLSSLVNIIKEKMPTFFNSEFHLEIYDKDKASLLKQIDKYVISIKNKIEIQGKNGYYTGFTDRPFETIRNIITYNRLELSWEEIKPIAEVAIEFVLSPNQSCSEKQQAITLITTLILIFSEINELYEMISSVILQEDEVLKVNSLNIFDATTAQILYVSWTCLGYLVGQTNSHNVIDCIASIMMMDNRNIIECLNYLARFLNNAHLNDLPNEILSSILQLAISLLGNKESDIKYLSVKCLIELTHSDYQDIALNQLSLCMDVGIPNIRILIIRRINQIEGNAATKDYIIQKALIDNHFIVRELANGAK